jgi:hypothetical protein
VSRTARIVLVTVGAMIGLFLWVEVLVRDPTIAAVLAAVVLAFLDWWRRKRRLLVRKDED